MTPAPGRSLTQRLTQKLTFPALALLAVVLTVGVPGQRRPPPTAPLRPAAERPLMADLTLSALSGPSWTLSRHRGRVVLLNYWATWCPPCQAEAPALVRIARDYRGKGLDVAGVSVDQDAMNSVPPFVAEYRVPYPVLLSGPPAPGGPVRALPTTFLIDRQGRVADVTVGALDEPSLRRALERLLREPPGD